MAAALLFLTATPAAAGTITGTVEWVIARASDGLTYAMINGTASGQPACATEQYWIIMDENSEAGKKQYAMLLLAQASGQQIAVGGHNTCTRWPDGEDIDSVQIITSP
jgi:hypothetical protein